MKFLRLVGCLLILALGAAAALGYWGWRQLEASITPPGGKATLLIEPGTDAGTILRRLEQEGLIVDERLARAYLITVLGDPPLKAGEYRFEEAKTLPQVLDKLIRGDVVEHTMTLIEGLDLDESAAALAQQGFGTEQAFLDAMRDPSLIADLDPDATSLEGYLFPETYRFTRGTSEREIVETLVGTFRESFEAEVAPLLRARPQVAERLPTVRDLVTLASIIEKEAGLDEERPTVSAVYHNRLRQGIALYADPTVIYAVKLEGRWDGNLRRSDLQLDSPYNTYKVPGLPPGPIASAGLASLKAAAAPADVDYLYFVSRNDGSHIFARTLGEHNRNVDVWQRQYWRRRWAEERAAKKAEAGAAAKDIETTENKQLDPPI